MSDLFDNDAPRDRYDDAGQLRDELEQGRLALTDMAERLSALARAHEGLRGELDQERRKRELAERRLSYFLDARTTPPPEAVRENALRRQLCHTLEELQVMTDELAAAQEALRRVDVTD